MFFLVANVLAFALCGAVWALVWYGDFFSPAASAALAPGPGGAALVGPDLVGQPLSWGLASSGPRALVFLNGSAGLTAPLRDAKAARSALQAWLAEYGTPHSVRAAPVRGLLVAG